MKGTRIRNNTYESETRLYVLQYFNEMNVSTDGYKSAAWQKTNLLWCTKRVTQWCMGETAVTHANSYIGNIVSVCYTNRLCIHAHGATKRKHNVCVVTACNRQ